jgi:hypothetical protein
MYSARVLCDERTSLELDQYDLFGICFYTAP